MVPPLDPALRYQESPMNSGFQDLPHHRKRNARLRRKIPGCVIAFRVTGYKAAQENDGVVGLLGNTEQPDPQKSNRGRTNWISN